MIRFDEWSSFVAAVPKIQSPPRLREKHNNNRFVPYNKASSSLSQQKQKNAINDNNNNNNNQEPKINQAMEFLVYLGLGNSNLLSQQEMK